jgi:hypothetical protein
MSGSPRYSDEQAGKTPHGLLAEFENVEQLLAAAKVVRKDGYTRWDAHSPFPVHGMDKAMGVCRTRLPWLVFVMGSIGAFGGLMLVWWTNATSFAVPHAFRGYPMLIAGKPIFSLPANIPVIFETTVLLAAFGAVFGMLGLNRLPRLFNPLLTSQRFRRVTQDRFFISIEAADPRFDRDRTAELLSNLGAKAVEEVEA